MLAGGPELLPGSVVKVPPQTGGLELRVSAKPLKALGAAPPLRSLFFAHWDPQKFTVPVVLLSPITKAPLPRNAVQITDTVFELKVPARFVTEACTVSVPGSRLASG